MSFENGETLSANAHLNEIAKAAMFKLFALDCVRTWQIAGLDRGFFKTVLLPVTSNDDRSACEKEAVDGIASVKPLAAISIRCPMIVANAFGPEVCDVCQRRRRQARHVGRAHRALPGIGHGHRRAAPAAQGEQAESVQVACRSP